uniref:Putative Head Tail Connector Protein n=1 Tax=Siphoviridae sp. ctjZA23 TaxID=2825633 RepID=A0A8S5PCZ8_9CAUD|nr:MAG TPA: putative Head Tail Connector Protein [Siphoviridae sp. ctjZA23]
MAYLTHEEYRELGFESTREFDELLKRAELAIDLFIRHFYEFHDFDKDHKIRKKAVKLAVAYQIQYLDSTGILTAEDKQTIASTTLGRTTVSYSSNNSSRASETASGYNLSLDAFNALKSAGFLYSGVDYGRY